jgi:hypothetical protein
MTVWAQTPPAAPQDVPTETESDSADLPLKDTVMTRQRPEYDPIGTRLGGFFLYPSISVTEVYRDNINYTASGEKSDFLTVISPNLNLRSNWNNHALNFSAGADVGRYISNSQEDYEDFRLATDGRLDILRSSNVKGGFKFAEQHEGRSSPDQTGAREPVIYRQLGPSLEYNQAFNRLRASIGGDYQIYDYDDGTANNGTVLNMDDRDRKDLTGNVRVGYEIVPSYEAFVRGAVNQRNYDDARDDGGVNRDSSGWEIVAGLALDFGDVTFGNVFAGYMRQEFDDASLKSISGPSFGADLTWNPTRLTTVKGIASRTIEETTLSGAAGALSTRIGANVDHELLRNLILSANADYVNNEYEGITREDDIINIGPSADYLFNRYLRLRLRYTHSMRESNSANGDYNVNSVFLRLLAQY